MDKLSFVNSAFALISQLPVDDVFVSLKDGDESIIKCQLASDFKQRHFELLSNSRLYVSLDIKNFVLILRPESWLPF